MTWVSLKYNQFAQAQIKVIAMERAKLENCAQYVVPIGNKYCVLSTREIDKQKKDLGRPHVLRIDQIVKTSIYVAYPRKNNLILNEKEKQNGKKSKFRRIFRRSEGTDQQYSDIFKRTRKLAERRKAG